MKNGMSLKKSRFNYSSVDKEGNLLLCNFAKGTNSFCKILKDDIPLYRIILNQEKLFYDENNLAIVKLCEKGYLIPQNIDEDITLKSLYYNAAMDSRLMLIIMPTEDCNFRCNYCYESHNKGKMTRENQDILLKYIQRKLASTPKLLIAWFGGEPLEAYDIVKYIMENVNNMCANRKISFTSDMTTNGYNLDPDTFDTLYNLKVYRYQITLDGLKEQHDKQRFLANGDGTFDRILENLLYIKNNKKYKLANVTIRVNVSRSILERLEEFIEFYKNTFGYDERFSLGFTPVNDMGGESVKLFYNQFVSLTDIYSELNRLNIYEDKLNLTNITRAFSPAEGLCYASKKNTYVIGTDLSLYKCTVHFDLPENQLGYIGKNGKAIINEDIHNMWYINTNAKEMCKTCFLAPCCYGSGCPHKRTFFQETKDSCLLLAWKKEIKNAMLYLTNKYVFETIRLSGEKGENENTKAET